MVAVITGTDRTVISYKYKLFDITAVAGQVLALLCCMLQVREKAATCLGYLCVGETEFPYRKKVMESLLDSAAVSV